MLVRIDWNLDHESVLTAIINTDVMLLSGKGHDGQWLSEVRVQDRSALSAFQTYCSKYGISVQLTQLDSVSPLKNSWEYNLTTDRRTALELAHTRGYFDSPRGVSQQELGDELDITSQAVSARLQRGIRQLIASTLDP